ncbi:hypothetical protein ACF1BP_21600 [Streptomyces sp. NPDC014735]|uniref:hypothetical protein n=1 Tax=Streptomyces sp. NPDC014735 TaxID=3364887 RepID=UPI0036F65FE1
MSRPVKVNVREGFKKVLGDAVDAQQRRRAVLRSADRWQTYGVTRERAAGLRALWRSEVERLRAAGELLDTRDVLVEYGVRAEMAARGWLRDWGPLSPEAREPGRWPGSRDGGYSESITVRIDDTLADQVAGACWHTSRDAIKALRNWRTLNPGIITPRTWNDDGSPKGPLGDYLRLARRVTTPGTIWRAGLHHGLTTAHAMPPLPATHHRDTTTS